MRRELDVLGFGGSAALLAVTMGGDALGDVGYAFADILYAPLGCAAWGVVGWLADEALGVLLPRSARDALYRRARWAAGTWLGAVACSLLGDRGGWVGLQIAAPLHIALGAGSYVLVGAGVYALARSCWPNAVDSMATQLQATVVRTGAELGVAWKQARQLEARRTLALAASNTAPRTRQTVEGAAAQQNKAFDGHLTGKTAQTVYAYPDIIDVPCEVVENVSDSRVVLASQRNYRVPSVAVLGSQPPAAAPDDREMQRDRHSIGIVLADYELGYAPNNRPKIGPVVLTYAVELRPGVPLAKLEARAAEISHELGRPVRVVGSTVEVPRAERQTIALRPLLERPNFHGGNLGVMLGASTTGEPVSLDLAKAPHALIAGATGMGKSVAINVMLCSLLLSRSPAEVRFVLCDPKRTELAPYRNTPHLLLPVAVETSDIVNALQWCADEMERRYQALEQVAARDIAALGLPRIVVVVDEYADLSAQSDAVEDLTVRLAQKARAAGIHLVVATQHPVAKVITTTIKNNLPTRLCFKVQNDSASRVVLDEGGADALLGMGDSLCILPRQTQPVRVHGAYVSDADVKAVCDAWRAQGGPVYVDRRCHGGNDVDIAGESARSSRPAAARDTDYDRALTWAREAGSVSISSLQRGIGTNFNKAKALVERMDAEGRLGPSTHAGRPRPYVGD